MRGVALLACQRPMLRIIACTQAGALLICGSFGSHMLHVIMHAFWEFLPGRDGMVLHQSITDSVQGGRMYRTILVSLIRTICNYRHVRCFAGHHEYKAYIIAKVFTYFCLHLPYHKLHVVSCLACYTAN